MVNGKMVLPLAVSAVVLLSTGCAHQGLGSADYTRSEARVVVSTVTARVVSIRDVKLEGEKDNRAVNAVGTGIGAAVGASIGKETITRIAGGALGGLAGHQIASMVTSATSERRGIEVVVAVADNQANRNRNSKAPAEKLVTVTQEYNPSEVFHKGETVFMSVDRKGVARISKKS